MKRGLLALLLLCGCSRSDLYGPDGDVIVPTGGGGGGAGGGGGGQPTCGGGPALGDPSCKTCWDHDVVVSDDGTNQAFKPICGNTQCLPIVTSGHPAPSYSAPTSTCDLLPASVIQACPPPFSCDCLSPLLHAGKVWPFTQWNCSWICGQDDGGVHLWCSPP